MQDYQARPRAGVEEPAATRGEEISRKSWTTVKVAWVTSCTLIAGFFAGMIMMNSPIEIAIVSAYLGITLGFVWLVYYACGLLAMHVNVKVNYTRKINHFAIFFLPFFLNGLFTIDPFVATIASGVAIVSLALFTAPALRASSFLRTCFAGMDRPEDRPNTAYWLLSQGFAGMIILGPISMLLAATGHPEWTLVITLINGIGDGLAEPVGITFGAHEYRVKALGSSKRYVRSIEGSACVLLTSIVVLLVFMASFSVLQLVLALATIPVVMTVVEAKAPHTWDNPFLFLACGVILVALSLA